MPAQLRAVHLFGQVLLTEVVDHDAVLHADASFGDVVGGLEADLNLAARGHPYVGGEAWFRLP